ncbi:MAG: transglutaminase domain-containing protein [Anaeromyxobacteraceae bacterium]
MASLHLAALLSAVAFAASGGGGAVPDGDIRYRVEIAGEAAGWARLAVRCARDACDVVWESALAAPEPGRGVAVRHRVNARTNLDGRALSIEVASRDDGRAHARQGAVGAIPASLAEALLGGAAEGERRCLAVQDEESGRAGEACARREGAWLVGTVLGERVRFRAAQGALPSEVVLPDQRTRFLADAAASLPARAPRLFGAEIAGPPAGTAPARFCGRAPDEAAPAGALAGLALSAVFPPGASCRERTAGYLALARRAGIGGRTAVGVAHDGRGFVWHAWAELWDGARWVPVDPSFEEAPARGPRFTVARYDDEDPAARADAGRAVLACWGRGRVE